MSSVLYALGRWAVHARRLVLLSWVGVLVVVGGLGVLINQGLDNEVTIPGTESSQALDQLSATFPQVSGTSAQIIVVAPDGGSIDDAGIEGPVTDAVDRIGDLDQVSAVTSPYDDQMPADVNDDGDATLLTVQLDGDVGSVTQATRAGLEDATADLQAALPAGAQASLGGQLFASDFPALSVTEAVGLLVALVVLVVTLGSLVAAGLPLVNAVAGVGVTMGLLFAATALGPINSTTPMLAVMLGLAVGIDYALFVVSRHREQLRDGVGVDESVARAVATAGSAVVFAGLTVMIALVGLGVAGIPFLTVMGVAAAVGVGIAVLVSLTLLPALLGFAGERLRPRQRSPRRGRRARPDDAAAAPARAEDGPAPVADGADGAAGRHAVVAADDAAPASQHAPADHAPARPAGFFGRWVRAVTRVPALTIAAVVVLVGLLAYPALDLRLALPDAGVLPEDSPARVTYDLVSEEFGPGYNGPLIVTGTIVTSTDPVGLMDEIADELRDLPGVADVPLATPNPSGDTGIVQVTPEGGPTSQSTEDLVREIRSLHGHFLDEYGVDLSVTGSTAVGIDVSAKLGAALLPFGIVVVGLSLLLLTMVFRSVWVPIKASVGYLFSVGAAFGVVTLVFEHGFLADALHVTRTGPVISFMPIVLMGVLFGLAMDYEVFLVSRMREDYVHSSRRPGSARAAVLTGFQGSARVVTAAAIIMFAVFVAFVPEGDMNLKPIALGLAVGVAVDAFVVRMVLVPAVMALLGDHAWWMPRWLDRVLPHFDVEGEGVAKELALADWPEPGATDAVAAHRLRVAGPRGEGTLVGPVSVRVPEGGALVVAGPSAPPVSAFLLAVSGRLAPDDGTVKVTGLVLPERAPTVRGRVAVLDAARLAGGTAAAVDAARDDGARVVVVDRTESLGDLAWRADVAAALRRAHAAGASVLLGVVGDDVAVAEAEEIAPVRAGVLDVTATDPEPAPVGGHDRPDSQTARNEVPA
ncbi:MMPL family transporter [Puerhibacterium puerhi]|uniref:MMPL family transporter n=1 Tax=Puerhibacterium puerhi TaxID=2692623 RepID=UPI00135821B0|nr:MMPL family transporter [Puerhibacterium puerhi]